MLRGAPLLPGCKFSRLLDLAGGDGAKYIQAKELRANMWQQGGYGLCGWYNTKPRLWAGAFVFAGKRIAVWA